MKNSQTKIFCIGLSKTGTSSLAAALNILGYRTKDNIGVSRYVTGDLDSSMDLTIIDANDAFTDTPIPSFYQELDIRYPNSRFILTVREINGWLKSCGKQFNKKAAEKRGEAVNSLFDDIYGTTVFEEEKFTRGYQQFVEGALHYFRNRPNDLLVIDITAGEGWEKLCPFLGKEIPDQPFPRANITQIQWINMDDLNAIAMNAGLELLKAQKKIASSNQKAANGLTGVFWKLIHQDRRKIAEKAVGKSFKTIVRGLQKLTPDVPVISGRSTDVSYSEMRSWNHLWLVNPLDGMDHYLNCIDSYCLSFSLIQDGTPIMGVIYNPKTGTIYYAKRGKGAFRKAKDNAPVRMEKQVKGSDIHEGIILSQQQGLEAAENLLKKTFPGVRLNPRVNNQTGKARAFELIISGEADILYIAEPTKEWETAAVHAILKEQGMNLFDRETGEENRYNKPGLNNSPVIARGPE